MKAGILTCHFDAELATLLRPRRRTVLYPLQRRAAIKDIIEALGVPHTEVGKIEVNGRSCDFSYQPRPGEEVSIEALQPPVEVCRPTLLRPHPLAAVRFLADANVGRLGRLLRLVGVDTAIVTAEADDRIAARAAAEGRILLSRDRNLLKRRIVHHGRLVRACLPYHQLAEIVTFYGLQGSLAPFSRCQFCNAPLVVVAKDEVMDRLEPLTRKYYDSFTRCPSCDRIYWPGSHRRRLLHRLAAVGIHPTDGRSPHPADTAKTG